MSTCLCGHVRERHRVIAGTTRPVCLAPHGGAPSPFQTACACDGFTIGALSDSLTLLDPESRDRAVKSVEVQIFHVEPRR